MRKFFEDYPGLMYHLLAVLALIILVLSQLACGVSAQLPEVVTQEATPTAGNPTPEASQEMVVSGLYPDEPLNIRAGAGGTELGIYLHNGDTVTIYDEITRGDTEWCAIEPDYTRWVACRYLKGK